MKIVHTTRGTCAERIELEVEGGIITEACFIGGCHGNTQGIMSLVRGADARDVAERLRGIRCGRRDTSCPDQLALAIDKALSS